MNFDWLVLLFAIITVESGNDPQAYNEKEAAAGILQIRPICLEDVNQIYAGRFSFTLKDRFNPKKSRQICLLYLRHYAGPGSYERAARIWAGGPYACDPDQIRETDAYWLKIKRVLNGRVN